MAIWLAETVNRSLYVYILTYLRAFVSIIIVHDLNYFTCRKFVGVLVDKVTLGQVFLEYSHFHLSLLSTN